MNDFPSSRLERGRIIAGTGLKVGARYAGYHLKKMITGNGDEQSKKVMHKKNATQLYADFTRLRGTALKLAQTLSLDNAILPDEYIDVLSQAQYQVPPINQALVRTIIKKELGGYPEKVFKSFDVNAIAAASIGQVHKAELLDGTPVAVKVQYPNIRETISSDLSLARLLFDRLVQSKMTGGYFEEVSEKLLEETDYINEGRQLMQYHTRFNNDRYETPVWFQDYSTDKVLTMSFIQGRHLNEFLKENPTQLTKNQFGQLLWDFFHDQIDNNYTVYADAHPGNFLFTPDNKLGIIDFGCIKTSPHDFFDNYIRLFDVHLKENPGKIKDIYTSLEMLDPESSDPEFEAEFYDFCRNFGQLFLTPYLSSKFSFSDKTFEDDIILYAREATRFTEPRGSRHFIYVSRLHIGLYRILMKLGAEVKTGYGKSVIEAYLKRVDEKNVMVA